MLNDHLKTTLKERLTKQLAKAVTIQSGQPISGGCINEAFKLEASPKDFFLKVNSRQRHPDLFKKEKRGLEKLAASIQGSVPEVILEGTFEESQFLVLEYISPQKKGNLFFERLGRLLALLHKQHNNCFGFTEDNYIGSLIQRNKEEKTWTDFFINQRLEPLSKQAFDSSSLPLSITQNFDRLFNELDAIFSSEKPSLLHGDLWNGNIIAGPNSSPYLIDPACYFGHREMDIAMTKLFGGFSDSFYNAYNSALPLAENWVERTAICNLYPLLVHVILFGGSYSSDVVNIVRKF